MHTLALKIDYKNETAGWINCALLIDGEHHPLDASSVFPPFQPLLRFVKAVAGQRFPARFYWDEEGSGVNFTATAVTEDSPLMHLKIQSEEDEPAWFDGLIERDVFLQAFLPPILDFSKNDLLSEKEWYLPRNLVAKLHQEIVSGIPLRSDRHTPQTVECTFQGGYDQGYLEGRVFFSIRFEEEDLVSILMFDTNPFWQQLVEFLAKAATADLPASCEHNRILQFDIPSQDEPYVSRSKTRLLAEPLDVLENFRLKIITTWQDEPDFLLFDEVVDRLQFTQGFADSFRKFLNDQYQMTPDEEGKTFDLRALPIEKLTRP